MNREALARLRRLGVVKGVRNLKSAQSLPTSPTDDEKQGDRPQWQAYDGDPQPLPELLPGLQLTETADGACYVLDKVYPLDYRHGTARLHELLELATEAVACFCNDERLAGCGFEDYLFLDTETTGLGGAGTLAFMVGAAFFEDGAFVVRQYFLRDHGDEPAMLLMLDQLLRERVGLVTFNGQSFDLPLLEGRFLMNRMPVSLRDQPHLDLLPPSRRLWRRRFDSCALGALEQNVLGLTRTQQDVPGWLIPSLYNHYLRTGDGRELTRIFYHNRMDMLSMVTLATRIVRQFQTPQAGDHPIDLLGLGKWQADLGLKEEAEKALRLAATPDLPTDLYRQALLRLGYLLKRADRREEAVEVWQQVACISFEDVTAHVELAKQYEWHDVNVPLAQTWTERALALIEGSDAAQVRAELEHRLQRLKRKQAGADD